VRKRLSPAIARFSPPASPPCISARIATPPERNIIAPASATTSSPGSRPITTAGVCPLEIFDCKRSSW
jgi:hypothetical protein